MRSLLSPVLRQNPQAMQPSPTAAGREAGSAAISFLLCNWHITYRSYFSVLEGMTFLWMPFHDVFIFSITLLDCWKCQAVCQRGLYEELGLVKWIRRCDTTVWAKFMYLVFASAYNPTTSTVPISIYNTTAVNHCNNFGGVAQKAIILNESNLKYY